MAKNNVRAIRESLLMSKAELARKAGVSALTIDRVEKGMDCRMDTKRKIILALGFKLTEKDKVFRNDEGLERRARIVKNRPRG
jgi:DNA-binding XRE family transcriptional regulator